MRYKGCEGRRYQVGWPDLWYLRLSSTAGSSVRHALLLARNLVTQCLNMVHNANVHRIL